MLTLKPMNEARPKRRWFRYSLRTAMTFVFLLSVAFALVARHAHHRQAALAAVRDHGGTVFFDPKAMLSWHERMLGTFFGPETYRPVRIVNMLTDRRITPQKKTLPEDFFATLTALPEITDLGLENTIIAQSDWRNISRFPRLEYLLLSHSNISDDGVKSVSQLPELRGLSINDTQGITDAALSSIAQLTKLDDLKLGYTKVTDAGLQHLSQLSNLQILELQGVNVTSKGLEVLQRIPTLIDVSLDSSGADDRIFDQLSGLPNLKVIQLSGTGVTPDAIERFRASHPGCTVTGP